MPRIKLTKTCVSKLQAPHPSGKQTLFWDAEMRGFGVLCSGTTNSRTYVAQRDLPNGKTRRVTIAAVNEVDLDEARDAAATLLVEMRAGRDPKERKADPVTLRDALDGYLKRNKTLRASSRADYCQTVEHHLAPWLDLPIASITREMVEKRHRAIATEVEKSHRAKAVGLAGRYRAKACAVDNSWPEAAARYRAKAAEAEARTPPSGQSTANRTMRVLRAIWNDLSDRDPTLPPANPVRLRRAWFPQPQRTRMVRSDELPAFVAAVYSLENAVAKDYILALLFTGLRRREAATLTWDDVDFGARVIRLPAARTKSGQKLDLPMSSFVFDLLVARRAIGRGDYVFPAKTGHIAEPKFPLQAVADRCGVYVSAHDLRRTFVTVAESADFSYSALKALVNHSLDARDVTASYLQMTTERLREPAQRVCDRLMALCGIAPPAGIEKIAR